MSNTDGEDTQRTHSEEEKFAFRDGWLARHKKVIELEQELASLRQQLAYAKAKKLLFDRIKETETNVLREELKQQEEVIRELTSSLVYIVKTLGALTLPQDEPEALAYYEALKAIEKAKSLTTKDKWNQ